MKKRKIDPLEEIMSNPYYQLRDDYNYAEKVKGTISFGQYSMKYWALERDIVLDETKSEVTEEMFVKAIMDARKEGEILNDEDTFSKQGAYKLTYVDTGKTTELVDDQGFRWEASVYFVVDEDTYNENLQKMFRAEQALYDTYERILNNFGLAE